MVLVTPLLAPFSDICPNGTEQTKGGCVSTSFTDGWVTALVLLGLLATGVLWLSFRVRSRRAQRELAEAERQEAQLAVSRTLDEDERWRRFGQPDMDDIDDGRAG